MRATACLRGMPGFWQRTLEHAKGQTNYAIRMQGLRTPDAPKPLIQFSDAGRIDQIKIMSDKSIGGYSKAEMTYQPGTLPPTDLSKYTDREAMIGRGDPPHVLFKGSISTELPPNKQEIQRSGFAGFRTRDMGWSLFGTVLWNLDQYRYVALRVKSDGRKYFVNFQTESLVPTDLFQHILQAKTPGQWEIVTIPFSAFVRTNYGMVVEPQSEMGLLKVRSVGVSLTDRIQGPFELRVADIYATNDSGRHHERRDSGFDISGANKSEDSDATVDNVRRKKEPEIPEKIMM